MPKAQRLLPSFAALTLALSAACAAPNAKLTVEHRRAIVDSVQKVIDTWRDAINSRNVSRALSFYSTDPDFRWFENGQLKYRSARELGDTMRAMMPTLRTFAITLIEPDITPVAPGVAEVTSAFAQKMTDTSAQVFGYAGAVTVTVVHGDSGWKFLIGHTSLVPPPDSAPTHR